MRRIHNWIREAIERVYREKGEQPPTLEGLNVVDGSIEPMYCRYCGATRRLVGTLCARCGTANDGFPIWARNEEGLRKALGMGEE